MSETTQAIRDVDFSKRVTDADTLALLKGLKPSVVAAISQSISREFGALKICLEQHEERLAAAPEFPGKDAIARNILVALSLCDRIRAELAHGAANLEFEPAVSSVSNGRSR